MSCGVTLKTFGFLITFISDRINHIFTLILGHYDVIYYDSYWWCHRHVISRFVRFYRLFDQGRVHGQQWKHIYSVLFHNNELILVPWRTFPYIFWRGVSLKASLDLFLCRKYLNQTVIHIRESHLWRSSARYEPVKRL